MDSQRYINLACQQGFLSRSALKEAQAQLKDESSLGLWELLKSGNYITAAQAREVEAAFASGELAQDLVVDGYRVADRIGSGGMGDVYLGKPVSGHGSEVAVKMLPRRLCADPEHLQRFMRETRALEQLQDAHFTRFISSGQVDSRPYMIMELVRGVSLKEHLHQHGALRQREAIHILVQVSGAMIKAEDMRMVHRDLKPANILLAPPRPEVDEPLCAKVCDFGLVKFLQDRAESLGVDDTLTMSGIALGTPHYMSPEQATGERDIDHRSDMYSLAASLYHAMMGRTLFSGKTSAVIMYKQVTASIDVEPLRERGCDDGLVSLLRDLLKKERDERPGSWRDVYARALDIHDSYAPTPSEQLPALNPGSAPASSTHDPEAGASPIPGMPLGIYRARRRRLWAMYVLGAASVILLAAVTWVILPPGGALRELDATPQTFARSLESALAELSAGSDDQRRRILLQPGEYRLNLQLSAEHSGLELRAIGPGVILHGGGSAVLELGEGCRGIRLSGPVTLHSDGAQSVSMARGSELSLQGVYLRQGSVRVDGGRLRMDSCHLGVGLDVLPDSELQLRQSTAYNPGRGLRVRGSVVAIEQLGMAATNSLPGPMLWLSESTVRIRGLRVEGVAVEVALRSDDCTWFELSDAHLDGSDTAWRSGGTTARSVRGVTLRGGRVGIDWTGPRDAEWHWRDILIQAPELASGIQLDQELGAGVAAGALSRVPQAEAPSQGAQAGP